MLRLTPLSGSRFSPAADAPNTTLVEYGGAAVVWNLGAWQNDWPAHDCVILTSSTLQDAAALPVYYHSMMESIGYVPPIYATFPTVKMGQMTLYDAHAAVCGDGGKPAYSLEDIDNVFAHITAIKYSQAITVFDATTGQPSLSLVAHRAGHVIGGAFYVVQRLQDETSVVLTSDYHIAKELHLDSSTLLQHGSTPDVLVTHPGGPAFTRLRSLAHGRSPALASKLVSQMERQLMETILPVLRREGHVLLPVDAAGRVLEVVLALDREWQRQRLSSAYNIVWYAPMVENTIEFVRAQLEWMATQLGHLFDSQAGHPYQLRHVQLCASKSELDAALEDNPSVVLASGLSMQAGPSRDVLLQLFDNPDHAIVFTDSSQCWRRLPSAQDGQPAAEEEALVGEAAPAAEWTPSAQLLTAWAAATAQGREMDDAVPVVVDVPQRSPLTGAELKAFLVEEEQLRQQRLQEEEKQAMLRQVELAKGELRLDQEVESKSTTSAVSSINKPRKKSRFDSTLFLKFSKPLYPLFEIREEAVGVGQADSTIKYGIGESVGRSDVLEDDYGIAVVPERFTDIVSGVDPSKFAGGSGRIGEQVLKRGLGYASGDVGRRSSSKGAVRVAEDEEHEENGELAEQANESVDLSDGRGIIRGRNGRSPVKVTTTPRKIEVLAEVFFVPLEGRVDARAARQSVRALQPRQVVVLGGPRPSNSNEDKSLVDEVTLLADASFGFASDKKPVLTPSDGEAVELAVGHAAYAVRLVDTPYRSREEVEAGGQLPQAVEPYEAKLGACTVSVLDGVATGQKVAADGSLVIAPRPASADDSPKVYLSDGEVLLTDLRAELIAAGMKADYSAHSGYSQLVVNGKIVVKKASDSGRFDIEGPLCEDFYAVRTIVCGQFVTL